MKIVIDIDEYDYKLIQGNNCCGVLSYEIYNAIKNGIPLDKIRAEIEHVKDNPLFGMVSKDTILEVILEIIDKYKAESEEV